MNLRERVHNVTHKHHRAYHNAHKFAHCIYFASVAVEAHGLYGYAALALLALTLVGVFAHIEEI